MVHEAGLREAAQPFLDAALNVFPEEWINPGSSYAIAITVRGSEVDALSAALRSTPAAPRDGYTETNRHADRIWAAAQTLNAVAETEEQSGAINDLLAVANALRSTPAAPKEDDRE